MGTLLIIIKKKKKKKKKKAPPPKTVEGRCEEKRELCTLEMHCVTEVKPDSGGRKRRFSLQS
jgi:hypothetical protein